MLRFLEFVFFVILIIYLLGLIGRALLGYWLRGRQREFEEQVRRNQRAGRGPAPREGEVHIERDPRAQEKKVNRNVGEYVDYEEVEEPEK